MVGFNSPSVFPTRKRGRKSPRVEPFKLGGRPPDAEENSGELASSKAGRTSEAADAFQIHSRKTRITLARAP